MDKKKTIQYKIDSIEKDEEGKATVTGWAVSVLNSKQIKIDLLDNEDNKVNHQTKRIERLDLINNVANAKEGVNYGFSISYQEKENETYYMSLADGKNEVKIDFIEEYRKVLRNRKIKSFINKLFPKKGDDKQIDYDTWYSKIKPTDKELEEQRKYKFPKNAPSFSIVIPLYKTPKIYLKELIESLTNQTYSKFEVCFADASDDDSLKVLVNEYSNNDRRFKYKKLDKNMGISDNTNEAIKMATGTFIAFGDHDDLLTPNAFFEFAKAILANPKCDCIYSDEDKVNSNNSKHFDPHFKPDYNIDLLTANNYICHLFACRKTLIDKYGMLNHEYDGAQDHDFILRMTENARKIVHVPMILYHWRTHINSTALNPQSKLYAYESGKMAIKAHYERVWPNLQIDHIEDGVSLGIYHTIFKFKKNPLVSVIIPSKDHIEDLDLAIRSLLTKSTWPRLEIIVIENNSTEERTWKYYEKIQKEFSNVKVVYYKDKFNYSKLNNFGVKYAKGKYYLFMNNDIEMINPKSIEEMMGYAQRGDVGVVGCRLLYPDDTIQHGGVIVGMGGVACHLFIGQKSNDTYFNKALITQDLSAVTAAVMMVRKDVFESVDGFDEKFAVAFNDIDFCLRVRKNSKLVVYNPYALFHHYESKSRGAEDSPEKIRRFYGEIARFINRWEDFLVKGDPYYNMNLSLHHNNYKLRDLNIEKIGEPFYKAETRKKYKRRFGDNYEAKK